MKSINFLKNKGVDIDGSLNLFGDVETYNTTIGEFLVGIHNKIKILVNSLQSRDMANYAIYAHSMKSDAYNFGFRKLGDLAYEHETKSKAGDVYYISEHINDLITETNNTIVLIQEYMNGVDNGEALIENDNLEFDTKTILVVDDSNIVRNFVKRIFSERYNVAMAKDGKEAIDIINANSDTDFVEAILLDLNMPGVDGFGVLEYMRQNNLLKKMPVSIISGDSSKETIDRAFTYEIVDMVTKPFNDSNIKSVVEKTIYYKEMI